MRPGAGLVEPAGLAVGVVAVKNTTIRQALQHVADYPNPVDDESINAPVHELVARALYDIANHPDASVRGSMAKANKARKMIFDRLGGRRRAGTPPQSGGTVAVEFVDMTGGALNAGPAEPERDGEDR